MKYQIKLVSFHSAKEWKIVLMTIALYKIEDHTHSVYIQMVYCKTSQKAYKHIHTHTRSGISSTICMAKEFTGANNSVKCLFDNHNILRARTKSQKKRKDK